MAAGRPCSVCKSHKRQTIEDQVFSGVRVSQLSQQFAISSDSIYRHIRNHAAPELREAFRATARMNTASLITRVLEVADSAKSIRMSASSETVALKAGAAEVNVLMSLVTRLGLSDDTMLEMARDATALAAVVGKLAQGNRVFGERMVEYLANEGADDMASMLSAKIDDSPDLWNRSSS
ncbi:hypothetical protein [Leucobacter japonicus]|uniref:hypothetical protein n=1 Tax=Leucobacter japonicus TaxID=1461259 RepID=UPI0012E2D185|nr:hypothetical protein [Leucobacter japonicus]